MGPHTAEEWHNICTEQEAEIDRLRVQVEKLRWNPEFETEEELDRLRAENAELRVENTKLKEIPDYLREEIRTGLGKFKTAKEGE